MQKGARKDAINLGKALNMAIMLFINAVEE